jgi:hypothetical protein
MAAPAVGPNPGTDAQCRKRCLFGRLHDHGISGGQRRGELPRLHQHGVVPRNDLSDYPDGLMARVTKKVAVNRNRFPLNLIGPSREIAITSDCLGDIQSLCNGNGFTVVEGLEAGKFIAIVLDKIGENVEQAPPLRRVHLPPRPCLKRCSRCVDCLIYINGIGRGNLADFLTCGRIDRCESLPGCACDPAIVDQKLIRWCGDAGLCVC